METLKQDIQYGFRMLFRYKTATIFCLIALALGIGANTAIFSVFNAVLLRPLPYRQPDRIIMLYGGTSRDGFERRAASYPEFKDWRDRNHVFEQIAAVDGPSFNLTGTGTPERIQGELVSANYFAVLGVQPFLGRSFTAEEDQIPDRHPVAIISHGLWERRFAASPDIVGKPIRINDRDFSIVGVMPTAFRGAANDSSEIWLPMAMVSSTRPATMLNQRQQRWLAAIGRLKPGVDLQQAQSEMNSIAATLAKEYPAEHTNRGVELIGIHEEWFGSYRLTLMVLLGAVGFVLLIACANVANLLLARVSLRKKEGAIRSALGATRGRVVRLMLVESCLLALIGGAIGVLIGMWSADLLLSGGLIAFPAYVKVSVDGTVLAFTLAASLLTGLIFGAAPALQIAKSDLNLALKDATRGSSAGRHRLLELLVVAEVTLCVVLLVGAGLMIRTVRSLQNVDPGFNRENVLRVEFNLPTTRYNRASGFQFVEKITNRVATLPGVQRVAFGSDAPWSYTTSGGPIEAEGQAPPAPGHEQIFYRHYVTTDFFNTLGIQLIRGRQLTAADTPQSPSVVVISEALAHEFWPGADPIGQRVRQGNGAWLSVVGVVRDVTYRGFPRNPDSHPDVYFPLAQFPDLEGVLLVKTSGSPLDLAAAVRHEINALDAALPAFNVTTMQELGASQTSQSRFTTWLLTIFGGLAVFLAVVGVYGVMSYSASRRTNEIGIRMTLGARQRDVMRMLILRGVLLVGAGLAAGLGLSLLLTRSMSKMLYGVTATDPATFTVAAIATAVIGAIANYIPARRATRVDPSTALRFQ